MTSRLAATLTAVGAAGALLLPHHTYSQETGADLRIMPVRGNVFMVVGGSSNLTVSAGADGLLLVDTGAAALADTVLAKIREIGYSAVGAPARMTTCVGPQCYGPGTAGPYTPYGWANPSYNAVIGSPAPVRPIRWIVQTTVDRDHIGATGTLVAAGRTFLGLGAADPGATVVGHERLLRRMGQLNAPPETRPTETYGGETYKMSRYINGEGVQLYHAAAVTDADTFVHFRFSDVISAGDVFAPDRYPAIDMEKGGTVQGVIDGLNTIIEVAFPEYRSQGGTMIIPGHGRLSDSADVAIYRNMVVIVRDRIRDLIEQRLSLEQIRAARPTLDFDGMYGSPGPFIEAVYRDLIRAHQTGRK